MKMANEGTASTLVLVAAILQLLIFIAGIALVVINLPILMVLPILLADPIFMIFGGILVIMLIMYLLYAIFGIIFGILWFLWRGAPSKHRTALIVTGILGIILAGFLPGLLALIGGFMAKKGA
jgi:hypothetical protein